MGSNGSEEVFPNFSLHITPTIEETWSEDKIRIEPSDQIKTLQSGKPNYIEN